MLHISVPVDSAVEANDAVLTEVLAVGGVHPGDIRGLGEVGVLFFDVVEDETLAMAGALDGVSSDGELELIVDL